MKKVWLVAVAVLLALGLVVAAVPRPAAAVVNLINVNGDCSGATIQALYSGAQHGDYQDSLFQAWLGDPFAVDSVLLDGFGFPVVQKYGATEVIKNISLSWSAVPQGTAITIYVDHWIDGTPFDNIPYETFTYSCGPATYVPVTADTALITADTPVYGGPQFGSPIPGAMVYVNQDFPIVDTISNEGVTWYQVYIGGATPWVPSTAATAVPR